MKRALSILLRVVLVSGGLIIVGLGLLFSKLPRPTGDRLDAGDGVVGIRSGGSYAWIVRTKSGVALVDAGQDPDAGPILRELEALKLKPADVHTVLLTHAHRDHWAAARLFDKAKIWIAPADARVMRGETVLNAVGPKLFAKLSGDGPPPAHLSLLSADDGPIEVDGEKVEVLHVPGHTPGSVLYLYKGLVFTGDSLFGKGDRVVLAPSFLSEDVPQNRASLKKLQKVEFTRLADGHSGLVLDAKKKLEILLGSG